MTGLVAAANRTPYVGLIAWFTVLCGLAMGHTVLVLTRHIFDAREELKTGEVLVCVAMGIIGWAMIWRGRGMGEAVGTWLGYVAGSLIWVGWFELAWKVTSHALKVSTVDFEGQPILSAELQVIQASALPFLVVLMMYYVNKETRCSAVLWIRRKTNMNPGQPLTGKERNFAALTAFETMAVTWACYIITIFLVDPRIVGNPMTEMAQLPFLGFTIWGFYLITRVMKHKHFPGALRYAIASGNIFWIGVEAGSRMGIYPEVWIKPVQYPVAVSVIAIILITTLTIIWKSTPLDRSAVAA
ncbi:MAG: hypothetical protein FJX59_09370 [Alphaproteobacteria bacterium]|nr:hypothetical protein [Alphaproteobacteria bacterium]